VEFSVALPNRADSSAAAERSERRRRAGSAVLSVRPPVAYSEKLASLRTAVKAARCARTFRCAESFGLDCVPGSASWFLAGHLRPAERFHDVLSHLRRSSLPARLRFTRCSRLRPSRSHRSSASSATIFSGAENLSAQELTSELAQLVSRLRVRSFAMRGQLEHVTSALMVNVRCGFWPLAHRAALALAGLLAQARKRGLADAELSVRAANGAFRVAELCAKAVCQ